MADFCSKANGHDFCNLVTRNAAPLVWLPGEYSFSLYLSSFQKDPWKIKQKDGAFSMARNFCFLGVGVIQGPIMAAHFSRTSQFVVDHGFDFLWHVW